MPQQHNALEPYHGHEKVPTGKNFISLDCWDEILNLPPDPIVVRASGNWVARLAALAVLVDRLRVKRRHGNPEAEKMRLRIYITVCPSEVC